MTRRPILLTFALATTILTPAAARAEVPPLTPVTRNECRARAVENVAVPTRGGDVYARIVRPDCPDGRRVPVILTYSPYALLSSTADTTFVRRGYASVLADVIGTGNSSGCWDYGGERERASAYDLVEWLGGRGWSNGRVAMIGASYDGTTANMAAVAHPPSLVTIVPEVAISDWYGYAYGDGVRYFLMDPAQRQGLLIDEQGFDTPLSFDFTYALAPPRNQNDPGYADRVIARPCPGMLDKLEHTTRGYEPSPDYDEFWRARGYINEAANLDASVLVQGGWRDYNVKHSESSRWFDAIPVDDPSTQTDEGTPFKMLWMGQGAHGADDIGGFSTVLHAWFDHFLYGYDTGITAQLPAVSKTNDGVVHRDPTWPPPGTDDVRFALTGGKLKRDETYVGLTAYVLSDSASVTESRMLAELGTSGTTDVHWFITPPLRTPVRIAGMPRAEMHARTYGTSAHFTPVLFDLGAPATGADSLCQFAPPTQACVIARGFLDARHRSSLGRGEDLAPGKDYQATVRFIDNDWVVRPNHRIAIAVSMSNAWWAVPNAQRAPTFFTDGSRLILPIVGGAAAAEAAGL